MNEYFQVAFTSKEVILNIEYAVVWRMVYPMQDRNFRFKYQTEVVFHETID